MTTQIRAFRRDDRDQLTALVNAHVQAVVPGMDVSVNRVLSQLEREPGEFIVDPWVEERATLVAEQSGRIVAAAHLLRYGDDAGVGETYRGAGEIRWLLCWPEASYWPRTTDAGTALAAAAVAYLIRSGVRRIHADGALPAPGVYGIPEQWPHIRAILDAAGFAAGDRTEIVFLADVDTLNRPAAPLADLTMARTVGVNGTRLTALLAGVGVGYIEVDSQLGDAGRLARQEGGRTSGTSRSRRGIAGGASPAGCSAARPTGFASDTSTGSSPTPRPTRQPRLAS